jgi:hypothetical protein
MTDARPKGAVGGPLVVEGTITPPLPPWRVLMKLSWDRVSEEAQLETLYEETGETLHRNVAVPSGRDPGLILRKELVAEAQRWVGVYPDARLEYFDIRLERRIVQKGATPSVQKTMYGKTFRDRRPLDCATAKVRAHVERALAAQHLGAGALAELARVLPARVTRLLSGGRVALADLWAIDRAARALGGEFTPIPSAVG